MPKSEIHPKWYPDAKVICNGEVVMTTGSTQPELHVDVWSGNHPFFTGTQKSAILMMLLGEDEASEILKNFSSNTFTPDFKE